MSVTADDDRLHASPDSAFRDAVTFAFGDPAAKLYGLARLSHGAGGPNGLAVLYAGSQPVAAGAGGGEATADDPASGGPTRGGGAAYSVHGRVGRTTPPQAWEDVTAAGLRVSVVRPLEAWTVAWRNKDGAIDLRFEARSAPAELDGESPVARAGGMEGYDQLCQVTGSVSHGGRTHQIRCLGQRGQLWGKPDWSKIELARTVSAWMGDDRALTLTAVRPAKAKGHLDEAVRGFMFEGGEAVEIADPRLSTTYDGEHRQRRAGLELWMDEEGEHARRVAGEVLCGTSLDLGEQRLDSAFFAWRMEGRTGVGRYDVLRRAAANGGRKRSR